MVKEPESSYIPRRKNALFKKQSKFENDLDAVLREGKPKKQAGKSFLDPDYQSDAVTRPRRYIRPYGYTYP